MGLKSKPLSAVRSDVPVEEVTKDKVVRFNMNLPESLRVKWKIEAAQRKTDVATMIIEAMSIYLDTHVKK
jgi:hypothetical protein